MGCVRLEGSRILDDDEEEEEESHAMHGKSQWDRSEDEAIPRKLC